MDETLDSLLTMLEYLIIKVYQKTQNKDIELEDDVLKAAEFIIELDDTVREYSGLDIEEESGIYFLKKLLEGDHTDYVLSSLLNERYEIRDNIALNLTWVTQRNALNELNEAINELNKKEAA